MDRAENRRAIRAAGYRGRKANNKRSKTDAIQLVNKLRYSAYLAMLQQAATGTPAGAAEDSEA